MVVCPLCSSSRADVFFRDKRRSYLRCRVCDLIFVPSVFQLSVDAERARYDLHDNTAANAGYVASLAQCVDAVELHVADGGRVLDFGCGKNAVLVDLLRRRGFEVQGYDPLYGIGLDSLRPRSYDVVILWEVIEHLHRPRQELQRVESLLTTRGKVIIKTRLRSEELDFPSWWYIQDITHVGFYSRRALQTVAELLKRKISFCDADGMLLFDC